jgi:mediator of RNA polymerase II transcription subunit 16
MSFQTQPNKCILLQSLQQLIQWVADLALNILAKLPENRQFLNSNKTSGDLSDIMALSSIRELIVIIRIWGLLKVMKFH